MIFDLSKELDQLTVKQKQMLGSSLIEDIISKGGCDLHLHTQASDGADSAAKVVQKVFENKLNCFSITDHDSIEGVKDVIKILYKLKSIGMTCPRFIPGIELSVQEEREVHILGYFPLGGYEKIESFLITQRDRRNDRNRELCELLTSHGLPISFEELKSEGGLVVGRLHAANILMRKGLIGSVKEAFNDWIGYGKPCYAKRIKPTAKEAIKCILDAGGIPVVAHPYLYEWTSGSKQVSSVLLQRLSKLKDSGLLGVEAFHGEASYAQKIETQAAARTLDLICTAGSDYHGGNKTGLAMYDNNAKFFHDNETVIIAALLEIDSEIFVVKKTNGNDIGKWYLPNGIKPKEKEVREFLKEMMRDAWGMEVLVKDHYLTTVLDSPGQRVTLISYRCDFNIKKLLEMLSKNENCGLFPLGTLAKMDMMLPDAIVIDHLREISFL